MPGLEQVGQTLRRVVGASEVRPGVTAQWIDPAEEAELTSDISAQLATLPTTIPDLATYTRVVESLPLLKRAEDKVVAFFKDIKEAAHKAHKAITTKETEQLRPIQSARTRLSQLKYAFEQEQDRIRRERERVAAEAEKQRLEALALEEAAAVADSSPEMAEQIIEQAIAAPAPVVVLQNETAAVAVAGVSKSKPRYVWRYLGAADHEVAWNKLTTDQRARIMALLPREYCMPNESAITKLVTGMDGNIKIPGVEIYDIGSTAVRG